MSDGASDAATSARRELWTVGHWNCPAEVLLTTLHSAEIALVADVRKLTGSRRSPQFSAPEMVDWLADDGVGYRHLPALAGRRPRQHGVDPVLNAGWQNASFKNYADYTLSDEFEEGLSELVALAEERRTVLLCGEPLPWRCHRLLIANVLAARGWTVVHLQNTGKPLVHRLGQWGAVPAVAADGTVTYPPARA
ncbi:MAG TPA: DUF488 domain-containing protein [Propionibacteriaceae bacterium]|nr:DUF488 domain-containing protein [Propionibacteriaceae bacterium]